MMLAVHGLQAIERQMRIDLRRRYVRVAEDRLDGTQVGAVFDHVRGAGMAQHMRRRVPSGSGRCLYHHLPGALPCQLAPSASNE